MKSKVLLSIIAAIIIAVALVAFASGGIAIGRSTTTTVSLTATTSSLVSTSSDNSTVGTLAVLVTDPPTIPLGVTALYMNYSDVSIHTLGVNNQSGWTDLQSSGEINLLGVLNMTETISAANVTSGLYNWIRFNLTGSVVTFQSTNYTAALVYPRRTFLIPIVGGFKVVGGQTLGVVVEMTSTVLQLGNNTNPTFALIPAAKGFTLPALSVSDQPHVGDRNDYIGNVPRLFRNLTHFKILSSNLTIAGLSVTVENTGANIIDFRVATLTSGNNLNEGWTPVESFGSVSNTSEFFVITPNSSMMPVLGNTSWQLTNSFLQSGYSLSPHQNETFEFSGSIVLGALGLSQGQSSVQPIRAGQSFILTILGSGQFSRVVVTADSASSNTTTLTAVSNSTSA